MINAVGREIPDEILEITGKEPFQGNFYRDDKPVTMAGSSDLGLACVQNA